MPEINSYPPGTPAWTDLGVPQIDIGVQFYESLFGWSIPDQENSAQTGGYRQAMQGDRAVAGMMPLMADGQPSVWTTYVSVDDADAVVAKVTESGGSVVAEPMDVLDLGRMAIFTDPEGAVFGIWQPGTFIGAGLANEPVSIAWNEVNSRDPDSAKAFYPAVFGWEPQDVDMGGGTYTMWNLGGKAIGGMADIRGTQVPEQVPPHWLTYFAVDDTDATVAKVKELGGEELMPAVDMQAGRFAIVNDLSGAHFGVIKLASE